MRQQFFNYSQKKTFMKKGLLALAACAMLAGSADAAMYLIGAPAGDWSPAVGIAMEEVDGGWKWSGTVGVDDYFAFATELQSPDNIDWDVFNETMRLSPESGDGTMASAGEYGLRFGKPEGAFHGNGAEVTYLVKEVDGAYTLVVSEGGEVPDEPKDKWSVIGSFNEWGDDFWMTEIQPGVWKATMYDFSGEFKFRANGDWAVNYGADGDGLIEADGDFAIARDGANFNIPEEVEEVIFLLDLNEMKLTVDGLTPSFLALRGSFVDWNFEWSYLFQEVDDDVYMLYLDGVEAGWEFKIANQDWSEEYTTDILDMTAGEIYELKPGAGLGNMGVDNNYSEVTMFFNLEDNYFTFYGEIAESVARTEIAEGKARYFNMQGCEVANPTDGIYIRVINGKSEKITVK